MTTAVAETETGMMVMSADAITPKAFDVAPDALKEKADKYATLTVNGLADKAGLKAVREARLDLTRTRCKIEETRKMLKAGALEFGRKVDSEAKRLTALVEPTEQALKAMEDDIAKEAKAEQDKRTAERMALLKEIESPYPEVVVAAMSEKDFEKLHAELKESFAVKQAEAETKRIADEAERLEREKAAADAKRIADEELARQREELRVLREKQEAEAAEAKRKADAELARQREELAKQRAEQEAREKAIAAETKKIEDAKRVQQEQERKRQEAEEAERSRKAEAERQERLAKEREAEIAAEAAHREAMKPDFVKLMDFAKSVRKLNLPTVSEAAGVARNRIMLLVEETAERVETIAKDACGVIHE